MSRTPAGLQANDSDQTNPLSWLAMGTSYSRAWRPPSPALQVGCQTATAPAYRSIKARRISSMSERP